MQSFKIIQLQPLTSHPLRGPRLATGCMMSHQVLCCVLAEATNKEGDIVHDKSQMCPEFHMETLCTLFAILLQGLCEQTHAASSVMYSGKWCGRGRLCLRRLQDR